MGSSTHRTSEGFREGNLIQKIEEITDMSKLLLMDEKKDTIKFAIEKTSDNKFKTLLLRINGIERLCGFITDNKPQNKLLQYEVLNCKDKKIMLCERNNKIYYLTERPEKTSKFAVDIIKCCDKEDLIKDEFKNLIGEEVYKYIWQENEFKKRKKDNEFFDVIGKGITIEKAKEGYINIYRNDYKDIDEVIDCSGYEVSYYFDIKEKVKANYQGGEGIIVDLDKIKTDKKVEIILEGRDENEYHFINNNRSFNELGIYIRNNNSDIYIDTEIKADHFKITKFDDEDEVDVKLSYYQTKCNTVEIAGAGIRLRDGFIKCKKIQLGRIHIDTQIETDEFEMIDVCSGRIVFSEIPKKNNFSKYNINVLNITVNGVQQNWSDIGFDAWNNPKLKGKLIGNTRKYGKVVAIRDGLDGTAEIWFKEKDSKGFQKFLNNNHITNYS